MILKVMSWNVNGLRARIRSGFEQTCELIGADIICLQETRVTLNELPMVLPGFHCYLNSGLRRGYSGTALYTKRKPMRVGFGFPTLGDTEGRIIVAEYSNFVLVNVYTPHSGQQLEFLKVRTLWDKEFARVCLAVTDIKSVIIAGDFNVAHDSKYDPVTSNWTGSAGYTHAERQAFDSLVEKRFMDTYWHIHWEVGKFSGCQQDFEDYQKTILRKRTDYILVDRKFTAFVKDASIERDIGSSNHSPVTVSIWVPC